MVVDGVSPRGRWRSVDARASAAGSSTSRWRCPSTTWRGSASDRRGREESKTTSIWPSIHPRLVELVREHRSTMIFVNSRRLAERLAADINETAGEELALAHHGSVAKEQRREIEERLKRGLLPAIVATSSLELGLDLGAVDLVIQIEAPPSVASGLQRIGRASHQVGAPPKGVIFPKHPRPICWPAPPRSPRMTRARSRRRAIRETRSTCSRSSSSPSSRWRQLGVDDLFALVRRAAPFAELPRASSRACSTCSPDATRPTSSPRLRPRITWDRVGVLKARQGAKRLAVINAE